MKYWKQQMHVQELLRLGVLLPDCQRDAIQEHVDEIVQFQKTYFENQGFYMFLGCIEICRLKSTKQLFCIDGQHRLRAMEILFQQDPLHNFKVDVEFIDCNDFDEVVHFFRIINMNKPVPEFLQNFQMSVAVHLRDHLKMHYKSYLKTSERPQRPNINLEQFLSKVQEYIQTSVQLGEQNIIEWFEHENEKHGLFLQSCQEECVQLVWKRLSTIESAKKLYLGTYWLDAIPKKISKVLRRQVWNKFYSSITEKDVNQIPCPCCSLTLIHPLDFECGHIISFRNGGVTTLDNLRPICKDCNTSMGSCNWDDFTGIQHEKKF
jgi:5-methylcytosine-specific restriction endonuclease McrA